MVRKNKGQLVMVLALGVLLMLVVAFSAMQGGGEEYRGEMRTKTLVYESDAANRIGLYWMDDEANLRKATPEEIENCKKRYPNEQIPRCQTTYYEHDDNEQ
jgi:hypothetical protein